MSFRENNIQQTTMFDHPNILLKRQSQALEQSWARFFSAEIFPLIDEKPFSVLYGPNNSRPNTPVNLMVGGFLLKALFGLNDEEFLESLASDIRIQYALHTVASHMQPPCRGTLTRFRARLLSYKEKTGTDLLRDAMEHIFTQLTEHLKQGRDLWPWSSLQLLCDLKKLEKTEHLHLCISHLLSHMTEEETVGDLRRLSRRYIRPFYYQSSSPLDGRLHVLLSDAKVLLDYCTANDRINLPEVQLLWQLTISDRHGNLRLTPCEDYVSLGLADFKST